MEKSKNENRNKWLLAISFVVFFVIVFKVNGQSGMKIVRQPNYDSNINKDVVTKLPEYPLEFEYKHNGIKDTAYLSIVADSVTVNRYGVRLYAYFSSAVELTKTAITIKFVDGKEVVCPPVFYKTEDNWCQYDITEYVYAKLMHDRIDYVKFDNVTAYMKVKEDCYFKEFLAIYYK